MGGFNKLSEQLGEGTGKGIVWVISKLFLGLFAAIVGFFAWYRPSQWETPAGKDFLKHNTWRLAVTSLLVFFFVHPDFVKFSFTHPEERSGKVALFVQLESGDLPPVPGKLYFQPVQEGSETSFTANGITYIRYEESRNDATPFANIPPKGCSIVPAGKSSVLQIGVPPKAAVNMVDEVHFVARGVLQPETLSEKILWPLFGQPRIVTRDWKFIRSNWSSVETSKNGISVTALKAHSIPYPHSGGLACF